MNDVMPRQPARPLLLAAAAAVLVAALGVPLAPQLPGLGSIDGKTMPLAPELPRSVVFEANEGQAGEGVAYVARAEGHRAEIYVDGSLGIESASPLRLTPVGASASAASAADPRHTVNYLRGNDSADWHTGIQTFGEVRFDDVYAGTDLVYHGRRGELEYDFVLRPGADVSNIVLSFEGAESLDVAGNGDLLVRTKTGTLRQKAPIAFQQKQNVPAAYELLGGDSFTFDVASYDRTKKLTIDPVLKLSTLLGGNNQDAANAIQVGSDGSIYVVGYTYSSDFPTKAGLQGLATAPDAFVSKLAPNGKSLEWSTYLGGNNLDVGGDLALDGSSRVFVTGYTYSTNFPLGVNGQPYQAANAGNSDAFLTILSADGQAIDYGTYFGGEGFDHGFSLARDSSGTYILGETSSTNLPLENPYQASFGGGWDVFLAKIDPERAVVDEPLLYSTYLGGTGVDFPDIAGALALRNGRAYIVGTAGASNFPTTADAHDKSFSGETEAFIATLDPSAVGAASFLHSTFVGGSGAEEGDGIVLDSQGNLYAVGETTSPDIATTSKAFDKAPARNGDGWLLKLRSSGYTKAFMTLLGGSIDDEAETLAVDAGGNIYVVGETESADFPTTVDRLGRGTSNGEDQLFATKFNKTGSKLVWSTAFGGPNDESAEGLALKGGNLYITGYADVAIKTTKGAFQTTPGDADADADDAIVLKLAPSKFHARKASLTLSRHLKAAVKVTVPDGAKVCGKSVPVKVQRKAAGKWKTVATVKTNLKGEIVKDLGDKPGDYRALAPLAKKQANAHICKSAKSGATSHKH